MRRPALMLLLATALAFMARTSEAASAASSSSSSYFLRLFLASPAKSCVDEERQCRLDVPEKCKNNLYTGQRSTTISGLTCQAWSSKSPHNHFYEGEQNFCRNPDNSSDGPWCLTTKPSMRFEACFKPCEAFEAAPDPVVNGSKPKEGKSVTVETDGSVTLEENGNVTVVKNGSNENGTKEDGTEPEVTKGTGPAAVNVTEPTTLNLEGNGTEGNVTEPTETGTTRPTGPTATTEPTLPVEGNVTEPTETGPTQLTEPTAPTEPALPGVVNRTVSQAPVVVQNNKTAANAPVIHKLLKAMDYAVAAAAEVVGESPEIGASLSFSGVPAGPAMAYVGGEAESCVDEAKQCRVKSKLCKKNMYFGNKSTTVTNLTCQAWSSQKPHKHRYSGEPENFCRNAQGKKWGPWCYTTDPSVRWGYCFQSCKDDEKQDSEDPDEQSAESSEEAEPTEGPTKNPPPTTPAAVNTKAPTTLSSKPETRSSDTNQSLSYDRCTKSPHIISSTDDTCINMPSGKERSWLGADEECQRLGGRLAIVKTRQDIDRIKTDVLPMKSENETKWIWLGAVQSWPAEEKDSADSPLSSREADWLWIDNSGFVPKELWAKGQPDDKRNTQACLNWRPERGFHDVRCNAPCSYLCGFLP